MFDNEREGLKKNNLFREIKDRNEIDSAPPCLARISFGGLHYINFGSNDYLGLAQDDSLAGAAKNALERYGFGAGASRLLAGGTELHARFERAAAAFKGTEAALAFNSGYAANLSAIPALAHEDDLILSDELNHASIVDACRLSRARKAVYRHRDAQHLSALMEKEQGRRRVIVTDTVFSMDGDIAPLRELYEICLRYDREAPGSVLLYLDDAHGTGVLGGGAGALRHFGITPEPWIIQMGTCSKALGSYGAFIAAGRDIVEWLTNTGRGFIYSTALPACAVAASLAALQLIQERPEMLRALWRNRERLFEGVRALGLDTLGSGTPIIPVAAGDVGTVMRLSENLLGRGIYAPAIRPPTVRVPRIRLTVTAAHTDDDIDALLSALKFTK